MKKAVYLLCGLPGSGKSTFAQNFAKKNHVATYSSDEWIIRLFGRNFSSDKFAEYQQVARQKILDDAAQKLNQNMNVVLDFGFWKKSDRLAYIQWAKEHHATPYIYYFEEDFKTLSGRLNRRNQELSNPSLIVTDEMLKKFTDEFEVPTSLEAEILQPSKKERK